MKKIVGIVSEEDKDKMIDICEKRVALDNLERIIIDETLSKQLLKSKEEAKEEYDNWWSYVRLHYHFEGDEKGHWELDFQTGNVTLVI